MHKSLHIKRVLLPAGATGLSNILDLGGEFAIVALILPNGWAAANVTFQVSLDPLPTDAPKPYDPATTPTNFFNVYNDADELLVTVGALSAARYVGIESVGFIGGRYFKIRSGTSGTPVDQTAERTIYALYTPLT